MRKPIELKRRKTPSFDKGLMSDDTKTPVGLLICNFGKWWRHVKTKIYSYDSIGQFRIVRQQKNRVEVEGNNLHFPLFWTIQNANYSPEPRLCSFVAAQFETSLLVKEHSEQRRGKSLTWFTHWWQYYHIETGQRKWCCNSASVNSSSAHPRTRASPRALAFF